MKEGDYICKDELLKQGWVRLVKYGSIANVFLKGEQAMIVNSLDNQIVRMISKEEAEQILKQWKAVLSATEFLR